MLARSCSPSHDASVLEVPTDKSPVAALSMLSRGVYPGKGLVRLALRSLSAQVSERPGASRTRSTDEKTYSSSSKALFLSKRSSSDHCPGGSLGLTDGRQRPADLPSREGVTLTYGDGSRTIVHAINCEGGGSAA